MDSVKTALGGRGFFDVLQESNISKNLGKNRNCGNQRVLYTFSCKRGKYSRGPPGRPGADLEWRKLE